MRSRVLEIIVFQWTYWALFPCNTRFENGPFALLPTSWAPSFILNTLSIHKSSTHTLKQAQYLKFKWLNLAKWSSVRLRTKWLWVRIPIQSKLLIFLFNRPPTLLNNFSRMKILSYLFISINWNGTRTHTVLVRNQILYYLAKLVKSLNLHLRLRTFEVLVWVQRQILKIFPIFGEEFVDFQWPP